MAASAKLSKCSKCMRLFCWYLQCCQKSCIIYKTFLAKRATSGYTEFSFLRQRCYICLACHSVFSRQKVVLRICVSGSENSAAPWQPIDCVHSPQSKLIFCQFLTPSIAAECVYYDSSVCI